MTFAPPFAPLAHLIQGPLDALLEYGLPVLILVALWWWSKRAEKKNKREGPK